MWQATRVTQLLGTEWPIIQAPMAGGISTPELVIATAEAGALGSLGAGYLSPEQLRAEIRAVRAGTDRPFSVNLFVLEPVSASPGQIERIQAAMKPFREELGIPEPGGLPAVPPSFEEQLAVVLEEEVPVFSFTFGVPKAEHLQQLKARGVCIIGSATTVREAIELERAGVDMITVQGYEAGAHRATFLDDPDEAMIGTMALVPQVVDRVGVPVIAAGGIMDGRGIVAALALGAEGVQLGTIFLACPESGAAPIYKESVLHARERSTVITRAFSGKVARGLKNRFIDAMAGHVGVLPPFPIQNALTGDIRRAAARQERPEFMSLWAGQGVPLCTSRPAGQIVRELADEVTATLERLRPGTRGSAPP